MAMCELADFSGIQEVEGGQNELTAEHPLQPQIANPILPPRLRIDVQIHISSDASENQIDQIFASMARHLYNKAGDVP
jgi:hypothetical protein